MKRTVPNYFAVDVPEIPRAYWEALFPKAYWSDLKRIRPRTILILPGASLIRQESEFNPIAVSRANAVGLIVIAIDWKESCERLECQAFQSQRIVFARPKSATGHALFQIDGGPVRRTVRIRIGASTPALIG